MLCSCDIAASSLSHSSNTTAHSAKSLVRRLFVVVLMPDELVDEALSSDG